MVLVHIPREHFLVELSERGWSDARIDDMMVIHRLSLVPRKTGKQVAIQKGITYFPS